MGKAKELGDPVIREGNGLLSQTGRTTGSRGIQDKVNLGDFWGIGNSLEVILGLIGAL